MAQTDLQNRRQLFLRACHHVFDTWTVLNLAVEFGSGGKQSARKKEDLVDGVLERFTLGRKWEWHELANHLETRVSSDFNTNIEDDSVDEVCDMIVNLHSSLDQRDPDVFVKLLSEVFKYGGASVQSCRGATTSIDGRLTQITHQVVSSDEDSEESSCEDTHMA
eukprot:GHVR01139545.1.p1 GENE.GHVR01139545.1~~GHVR01139545.1.p1  ORF type:complete len:164 (-),score=38.22 GHVR01139545.1:129-620(-)